MDPKYEVQSSDGRVLKVFDDHVILTQKGVMGFLSRGLAGDKIIYYKDVTSVQFKNCGWTAGYLEFTFPGSGDKTGGPISGVNNENRFTFGRPTVWAARKLANEMEIVNTFIQESVGSYKSVSPQSQATISAADEIFKFKKLLDEGIISQKEFEQKKKELLNL